MNSGTTARAALFCAALLIVPRSVVAQQAYTFPVATRAMGDSLYWNRQFAAARRAYESALALNPEDDDLRLAFGRMLVETLAHTRARDVLTPLLGRSQGRAEELLGTNAYWAGDFTLAQLLYRRALRADSTLTTARLNLYEIAAASATLFRVEAATVRDDQPLDQIGFSTRGEYFVLPLTKVWLGIEARRYQSSDSLSKLVTIFEDGMTHYIAGARTEVEYAVGFISGISTESFRKTMTDRIALRFRLPRHMVLRVRTERQPYLYTLESLSQPIMPRLAGGVLELKHPRGWLGEAAAQRQWFPDANRVTAVHLWFLAPVTKRAGNQLLAGYSGAAQHSGDTRFVLARPEQQIPPTDPRFDMRGRYSPYYTPYHYVTHSMLLAATTRLGRQSQLRTNASLGVLGWDDAPYFYANGAPGRPNLTRAMYRRRFNPVSVRGTIDIATASEWAMTIAGDYQHTPFYSAGTADVRLVHRFTRAAVRRVDR